MIAQRLLAVLLMTSSVAVAAQYAPNQPAYPDPAYQQGYAPQGYAPQGYYADGQSVPSVEAFYEPLSPYGRWVETRWGRAFQPLITRGWRPYTIGRWEDSPVYGRTWRSDEPFGWATYHYGRWGFDDHYGWVWVPDTVWGPGWVAWRDGDDFAGWAPLPPQVSVSFGLSLGSGFDSWDYNRWYEPSWVYVPRAYAYDRPVYNVILPYQRNHEFWEHTRGVTHYDRDGDHIVNRSFDRDRGHDFGRDRGQAAAFNGHDRDQRDLADHGRDGRGGYDPRAVGDRAADPRQGDYRSRVQPAYGQPHSREQAYGQSGYGQPGYNRRNDNQGFSGRPGVPAVPGSAAVAPGSSAPPVIDPRAAYANRDRQGSASPNGTPGGQRPDWERRREQAFQPATGGNVPLPFNRGDRGRADGYAPPLQNYTRAPAGPPPRPMTAPPAAAFARPAAPVVQPPPPRPAPPPRAEPQRSRGDNVKPQ